VPLLLKADLNFIDVHLGKSNKITCARLPYLSILIII
jgi:hypothetical protein